MKVEFEINNPQQLAALLTLLRALGEVSHIRVGSAPGSSEEPVSFFDRFYGSAKTGLTLEEIDTKLDQLRTEWDRTI